MIHTCPRCRTTLGEWKIVRRRVELLDGTTVQIVRHEPCKREYAFPLKADNCVTV